MAKLGRFIKKILLWLLATFILIPTLIYMPSDGSLCGILAILLLIPIDKWQNLLSKFLKGKVKPIVCSIMVIVSLANLMSMPPIEQDPQAITADSTIELKGTAEPSVAPEPTVEPQSTPELTAKPAPKYAGEAFASPTQAPTPKPTKAPAPTQAAVPAETPVPTVAPTTAEVPAPTEAPALAVTPVPQPENAPAAAPAPQPEEPSKPVEEQPSVSEKAPARDYIVNTNTNRFHYPSCSSVSDIKPEHRKEVHASRDDLINNYKSCGRCHP